MSIVLLLSFSLTLVISDVVLCLFWC